MTKFCAHSKLCSKITLCVEASSGVVVGCAQYSYAGLPDQLEAAGLTPWTNYWSQVGISTLHRYKYNNTI